MKVPNKVNNNKIALSLSQKIEKKEKKGEKG
jgi:hypothetical protein